MPGQRRRATRLLRAVSLAALLIPAFSAGGRGTEARPTWGVRVWQADEGLPDNRVVGLAQTPEGYLWVATRGGLVRFNGAGFEPFSLAAVAGVSGNGLRGMFADSAGNLWLDTFRETIVRVGRDAVRVFTSREGVPRGNFPAFAEDAAGGAWLVLRGRAHTVKGDQLSAAFPAATLVADARGGIWAADGDQVGRVSGGRFEPCLTLPDADLRLARARDGGIWLSAGARLYRVSHDGELTLRGGLNAGLRIRCLLEDHAGGVWIGTASHGLWRFDGHSAEPVETSHRSIECLLEDREGNIWVGTLGGGLNRLRPRSITLVGPAVGDAPGLAESLVSVTEDRDGTTWAVTSSGQLVRGDASSWRIVPAGESWPGGNATCVLADRRGTLWIGTTEQGLHEVHPQQGHVRTWRKADGLPGSSVRALFLAADESVWVGTSGPTGVGRIRGGTMERIEVRADVRSFRAITQDLRGNIWVGTSDGRILKVVGDGLVLETLPAGAALTSVRSLHATADGSLWIGDGDLGISWISEGRLVRFSTANGLVDDAIWQITSDRSGAVWVAGPRGLSRIKMEDARAVAEGRQGKLRTTLFGRGEGLRSFQAHYDRSPAVCRTGDGRILFATSQGLLVLDPEHLRENPRPPPVVLERVSLDDHVVALSQSRFPLRLDLPPDVLEIEDQAAVLRLPPQHRRVAFAFAALSFSAPGNVRFRYRLEGIDEAWTEAVGEQTARYSRLPAGRYTFRVLAANDMGVWNERGAALALVVRPFFWQTWWFWLGFLGAFTALVVVIVRLVSFRRLRGRLAAAEQMSALFQERARIARDIHDDVGGSLAHIKLLSELAVRERGTTEPGDDYLQQITHTTRQMLKSLDEIVWAINPRNDTLPNLISYVGQYAVEFLRAAGIRCAVDLPDNPPEIAVGSDVRHHVFLVVKEALTNAVRHGEPRTVRIEARVAERSLEFVLADDGRGFVVGEAEEQGDGLRNMRQRIAALGGRFELESTPGAGTRLRLHIAL